MLQETFLYAWRNATRFDPDRASAATWLVLITRSRALDRVRRRGFQRRTREEYRQETEASWPSQAQVRTEGFGRRLEAQRRHRVRRVLAALPEEQRRVLDLAYYGGLSQSEIAHQTGIPLGTVKTRTLLALRKLRGDLGAELRGLL